MSVENGTLPFVKRHHFVAVDVDGRTGHLQVVDINSLFHAEECACVYVHFSDQEGYEKGAYLVPKDQITIIYADAR
jgi:hypothetical protein